MNLQEDSVLRDQLLGLILGVHLEVTILTAHASVQKLIEEHIAIITSDGHLKHDPLLVGLLHGIIEAQSRSLVIIKVTKSTKEWLELTLLDAHAVVSELRELSPDEHELLQVGVKLLEIRIILVQIVLLELLNDNQDEKIQHDISVGKYKNQVVRDSHWTTTGFAFNTIWRNSADIEHYLVPIFTRRRCKDK